MTDTKKTNSSFTGTVSPEQVDDVLKNPQTFVLDVRTQREYDSGAMGGAHLIPVDQLPQNLEKLPQDKDTQLLIYCAHGVRSLHALKFIEGQGYKNACHLGGGLANYVHWLSKKANS